MLSRVGDRPIATILHAQSHFFDFYWGFKAKEQMRNYHTHTHIYIYIYIHTHISIYMGVYKYIYMYVYIYIYVLTLIYIYSPIFHIIAIFQCTSGSQEVGGGGGVRVFFEVRWPSVSGSLNIQ